MFSWNFSFALINCIQCSLILYQLRPLRFSPELEEVYESIFLPFKVSRYVSCPFFIFLNLSFPLEKPQCTRFPSNPMTVHVNKISFRYQFKKLVSSEHCSVMTLHHGEAYATQEVTKTDRLSLMIKGTYVARLMYYIILQAPSELRLPWLLLLNHSMISRAHVTCNGQFLHYIQSKQFLDSPEFESCTHGDEKFHVSYQPMSNTPYMINY